MEFIMFVLSIVLFVLGINVGETGGQSVQRLSMLKEPICEEATVGLTTVKKCYKISVVEIKE